eukprot:Sspe_Gene.36113::Locus_17473_Transcript_1_1_Confidence_1.000_Length_1715::g.36113::m.36113/K19752/DNAAF3, PF22; dynein assembly factor 3, axonemal
MAGAPSSGGLKWLQSQEQDFRNSVGTESNWGWSPAFDLLDHVPSALLAGDSAEPVSILLDSPGDLRHLFITLSRARRHTKRPIHFYLYEPNLRHHARHLFFLTWLFEQTDLDRLEEAAAEFLELYGNSLLKDGTVPVLKNVAKKAANLVRGGTEKLSEYVDTESFMKLRESDWIAEQIDSWTTDKSTFNVDVQWNNRVRVDIGDRYDAKENVMDWDFNMGLMPYTSHVRWPEYKDWRLTGVAFDYARINPRKGHKYEYVQPNKTLAHFNTRNKTGYYVGDVRCGPYSAVGIDTEYRQLQGRQHDGTFKWASGIIAMHNVRAWLYELLTGEEWVFSDFKHAWDSPDYVQQQPRSGKVMNPAYPPFKVFFSGIDISRFHLLLDTRCEPPVRFHAAFHSAQAAQNVTSRRQGKMREDGLVIMETAKFCVYMEEGQKQAFTAKVMELGGCNGWVHAPAVTTRLHRLTPAFAVPFARKDKEKELTPAQKKEKEKHESPWAVAFVRSDHSAPPPHWGKEEKAEEKEEKEAAREASRVEEVAD